MTTDKLTVAEETLCYVLATNVAARTGAIAREHGWPQPDEAQLRAMTQKISRVVADIVIGMRSLEQAASREELDQVINEVALGTITSVMGARPTRETVH